MINGKKSYIGIIGYFAADLLQGFGIVGPDVAEPLKRGFLALGGVGLAHKVAKMEKKS